MALRISQNMQLHIPKMSHALMKWGNKLSSKQDEIQFSLGDPESSLTVRLYSPQLNLERYKFGMLIEIDGVPASVWLTSWPMAKRMNDYLGGKKLEDIPLDLRAELVETALKPLLSALMFHTNSNVRVLNFLNLKPTETNPFSLGIMLRDNANHQEARMILLMHDKLFPVMRKLLAYWPDKPADFWYRQPTHTWVEAGKLSLTMQELSQLQPSDILLMEHAGEANSACLRLRSDQFFYASINNNQLTIESGIQNMSDEINEEVINSIEEVPVRITFDLGDMVMPFKEIQSLNKGCVIDLNKPVSNAVTIRSLNKVIGTGELVDIDGHIGVRIINLLNRIPAENVDG